MVSRCLDVTPRGVKNIRARVDWGDRSASRLLRGRLRLRYSSVGQIPNRRMSMNRGLWLACSLALGTAFAAAGCYMGPQPPPPAYVEPAPAPVAADDGTAYPATPPPTPSRSISRRRRPTVTARSAATGTGPASSGAGTLATGRPRTRPTSSSARGSCSSTGGRSTTGPIGRVPAAPGLRVLDTVVGRPWARGARGPLWRQARGERSTTRDGGAPRRGGLARRTGAGARAHARRRQPRIPRSAAGGPGTGARRLSSGACPGLPPRAGGPRRPLTRRWRRRSHAK